MHVEAETAPKRKPQPSVLGRVWRGILRPTLFWGHLVLGVLAGVIIVIMSVTGVLLTYQRQMQLWADLRGVDGGPVAGRTERLSVDSLVTLVRARGEEPTSVIVRRAVDAPVEMVLPQRQRVYVSAYTGAELSRGNEGMRSFFRTTTELHRWIAMKDESRATGKAVTGAANLAFLLIALSGFWLWWPRNWTRVAFRNVMLFRTGLSAKARDFNWHHVLGFWSLVPLVIVIASGAVISYPWASDLVYAVAGEKPPARAGAAGGAGGAAGGAAAGAGATRGGEGRGGEGRGGEARVAPPAAVADANRLARGVSAGAARDAEWRSISVTLPKSPDADLTLSIDRGTGGEPQKRAQLVLAPDGSETRWQPFESQSTARRWRSILRFAHTGEVLGLPGQTIAGLVSLFSAVLVYTGLALSWRRMRGWLRSR